MAVTLQTHQFEAKLKKAIQEVKLLLEAQKTAPLPSAHHHCYEDKYHLVERVTLVTLASQLNCLSTLGLGRDVLAQARQWAQSSQVSFRFRSQEKCTFLREETRRVEDPTKVVNEVSVGGLSMGLTSKTVTKVTEFIWKFEVSYELELIRGVGADASEKRLLQRRNSSEEITTGSKVLPHPESNIAIRKEANITYLLQHLAEDLATPVFQIDRSSKHCKTPRRNAEVEELLSYLQTLAPWVSKVTQYLAELQQKVVKAATANVFGGHVLVPSLPLFVNGSAQATEPAGRSDALVLLCGDVGSDAGPVLSAEDCNRLLAEEARLLAEKRRNIAEAVPDQGVYTPAEAYLGVCLRHCNDVLMHWSESMSYVEQLLRDQLVAAIGKEVTPAEFAAYMQFHYRKLFQEAYAPSPFSFAARRSSQHSPEGAISVEESQTAMQSPISTLLATDSPQAMNFELDACTTVSFTSNVHLHACLVHQFSGQSAAQLSLVSRARQFSSFIVMVGRVISATSFDPKFAMLLQNKDELQIPLDLSTIPTPKEFKDAIESLSPEQRAFAKAFRAMQLESTLFGILVIQVKPQLEQLLKLPDDSLTKEIKLTQDLMQLFIRYQIPSDLLSFSDDLLLPGESATPEKQLQLVKGQVEAMQNMIEIAKEAEIQERRQEEQQRRLEKKLEKKGRRSKAQPDPPSIEPVEKKNDKKPAKRNPRVARGLLGGFGSMMKAMVGRATPVPKGHLLENEAMDDLMDDGMDDMDYDEHGHDCADEDSQDGSPAEAADAEGAAASETPAPAKAAPKGSPAAARSPSAAPTTAVVARDYTRVAKQMDEQFEKLDPDSSLRPTIITPANAWRKTSQPKLLGEKKTEELGEDGQRRMKMEAFDLLDAITKSGALPLSHATLHIVVAATHCFDKTVTETVIQENVNPIEKVERSSLIMASAVHQKAASALMNDSSCARVLAHSPQLEDVSEKVK